MIEEKLKLEDIRHEERKKEIESERDKKLQKGPFLLMILSMFVPIIVFLYSTTDYLKTGGDFWKDVFLILLMFIIIMSLLVLFLLKKIWKKYEEDIKEEYNKYNENIKAIYENKMTKIMQIYRCNICGNIVEVLHAGVGKLVCCGQPMELLKEKTEDAGKEKHAPVIEKTETGTKVKVGMISHPMEEKHYIEFIEVIADGNVYRKNLTPANKPEADFEIKAKDITARAYCNIHGLWKS